MPCIPFKSDDGKIVGIVCTRGQRRKACCVCGKPSSKLCDFELTGKAAGRTCDRPLCIRCSKSQPDGKGDTIDICNIHAPK